MSQERLAARRAAPRRAAPRKTIYQVENGRRAARR